MATAHLPKVSVIILNWNGKRYLRACLDSVLKTRYPNFEVIVVDNASNDGSPEMVKKYYPQVILIENKENLGFCAGNNVGIKRASGNVIVLLNNDTIVNENWLKEIIRQSRDPKVGVIGCRLYFPGSNMIQSLGAREIFLGYWEHIAAGQADYKQYDRLHEIDYVSGAAMAIKREVIEKIGLLDPKFYAYYEDVDFCYRAKRMGYKVITCNAIVYHYGSLSWNRLPVRKMYLLQRNSIYFILKHYPPKILLRYVFEYPIKSFKINLCKYIRSETVLQKAAILNKIQNRRKIPVVALTNEILRLAMFVTALLLMMVETLLRGKRKAGL